MYGNRRRKSEIVGGKLQRDALAIANEELDRLRPYARKIASKFFSARQDVEDAVEGGKARMMRRVAKGRLVKTEKEQIGRFANAVKCATIDLLRKKCGRADKNGVIKNPRPQRVEMTSTKLEFAIGASGPSPDALRAELEEWIEVIRYEKGQEVARVFELVSLGFSDREIAKELRLQLPTIRQCIKAAGEVIKRFIEK